MSDLLTTKAMDVKPTAVSWLWPGRVPRGKVTLLAGDPGLGKSFVTIDIAARVTRGGRPEGDWPDVRSPLREPGEVIFLSAEDDFADTIRPRLEACGADLSRIHLVEGVDLPENKHLGHVALDRDIEAIARLVRRLERPRLIVIDPISAYMGGADSNNNTEVRAVLANLARVAMTTGVAILCVTHLNKGSNTGGQKIVYRAMGSLAFTAAARMVWYISRYQGDKNVRAMTLVKNNVGAPGLGLTFKIEHEPVEGKAPMVRWLSTDLCADADEAEKPLDEAEYGSPVREAAAFLREVLRDGPMPGGRVITLALEGGINVMTLKRAKKLVGVATDRADVGGRERPWMWTLGEPGADRPKDSATGTEKQGSLEFQ